MRGQTKFENFTKPTALSEGKSDLVLKTRLGKTRGVMIRVCTEGTSSEPLLPDTP